MGRNVFLVEDHAEMREILTMFVDAVPGVEVCGAVATAEQALERYEQAGAELMLVDLSLPGMNGIELIEEIGRRSPELPCVILSGHKRREYVDRALGAGARGYILKGQPDAIATGISEVLQGRRYVSEWKD